MAGHWLRNWTITEIAAGKAGLQLTVMRSTARRSPAIGPPRISSQGRQSSTDLLPLVRKLTALLGDCPKWSAVSIYDRCKAVFERGMIGVSLVRRISGVHRWPYVRRGWRRPPLGGDRRGAQGR